METWSDIYGHSLKAEYVSTVGTRTKLKLPSGRMIFVLTRELTRESQAQAKAHTSAGRGFSGTSPFSANSSLVKSSREKGKEGSDSSFKMNPLARRPTWFPTEEEIKAFVTRYQDPDDPDKSYLFTSVMELRKFRRKADYRKFAKNGRVPYQFFADLKMKKMIRGTSRWITLPGNVYWAILDEKGTLVDSGSESTNKMCPS